MNDFSFTAPGQLDFGVQERMADAVDWSHIAAQQARKLSHVYEVHAEKISQSHTARGQAMADRGRQMAEAFNALGGPGGLFTAWNAYAVDAAQRGVLTLDTLRERGNTFITHDAAGEPPVLIYDYETVIDGRTLKRPVNYMLLKIVPPAGVEVRDWKRPYVIIDPRAGHGAGIGGFKLESQVGVALRDGHPVYFVAFRPDPVPGQTLADVMRAEATFVKEVMRRHPKSAKPIVVGNCQGGWATLLLAAANPDLTGPVVINGAPVATWSGRTGMSAMRYNGGLLGGATPALLCSDLGAGVFDGANLIMNFETLNPGRNYWRKYYDLFADVDNGREAFLDFEKWWGGFHNLNEAEINWIVQQLFVGNRLARGEARLERGRTLDLKQIRAPIIVFASHGDNITPPQQALNWIVDTYADENEIKIRGQRILYMLHNSVGHLGIFVSSSVAKKEHAQMASTLKTIEALAPGLYEMVIEDTVGDGHEKRFVVSFRERTLDDLRMLDPDRDEEACFAAVARLSEQGTEVYDGLVRPLVRAAVTPAAAALMRATHPMRAQRVMLSDKNPALAPVRSLAEQARADRRPVDPSNPFVMAERLWADSIEQSMDLVRDLRDAWYEWTFFSIYGSPQARLFGHSHAFQRTRKDPEELRLLPEVLAILMNVDRGGFAEAVIRMLIVLAEARGSVRRDRLERSAHVLTNTEPFRALGETNRAQIIHEQTVIVKFELERAIDGLPMLLRTPEERQEALTVVEFVVGALEEMEPHSVEALQRFRRVLGLPPIELPGAGEAAAAVKSNGKPPAESEAAKADATKPAGKAAGKAAAKPTETAAE